MKNTAKTTRLLLAASLCAAALCASSLLSCGDAAKTSASGSAAEQDGTVPETETEPAGPEVDLGGYEMTLLTSECSWGWWEMAAEKETGDTLNDATWKRNKRTEERLNIKITEEHDYYSLTSDMLYRTYLAGDSVYDAASLHTDGIFKLANEGVLYKTKDLVNLDLDNPWWNKRAVSDIALGTDAYMLIGDLNLMFYENHYAMMFNHALISSLGLEDPYQLVSDGKWTFDKMLEMARSAASDTDGDGVMNVLYDTYGVCECTNTAECMLLAFGASLIHKTPEGIPEYIGVDEHYVESYNKVLSLFSQKDITANDASKNIGQVENEYIGIFSSGRSLFLIEVVGELSKLRGMNNEFGIVVMPKFDEAASYITPVYYESIAMCVPVTADAERTSLILETMGEDSREILYPAYYDVMLGSKLVRDEKSTESLDVILSCGTFDIAQVHHWAKIATVIESSIRQGKTDIVSTIEKKAAALRADIEASLNPGK